MGSPRLRPSPALEARPGGEAHHQVCTSRRRSQGAAETDRSERHTGGRRLDFAGRPALRTRRADHPVRSTHLLEAAGGGASHRQQASGGRPREADDLTDVVEPAATPVTSAKTPAAPAKPVVPPAPPKPASPSPMSAKSANGTNAGLRTPPPRSIAGAGAKTAEELLESMEAEDRATPGAMTAEGPGSFGARRDTGNALWDDADDDNGRMKTTPGKGAVEAKGPSLDLGDLDEDVSNRTSVAGAAGLKKKLASTPSPPSGAPVPPPMDLRIDSVGSAKTANGALEFDVVISDVRAWFR